MEAKLQFHIDSQRATDLLEAKKYENTVGTSANFDKFVG